MDFSIEILDDKKKTLFKKPISGTDIIYARDFASLTKTMKFDMKNEVRRLRTIKTINTNNLRSRRRYSEIEDRGRRKGKLAGLVVGRIGGGGRRGLEGKRGWRDRELDRRDRRDLLLLAGLVVIGGVTTSIIDARSVVRRELKENLKIFRKRDYDIRVAESKGNENQTTTRQ
ncbi:hypothetical protein EAG_11081 [Camponotus floridanus]|uniref:Uncharacterized protein n=1 Tax=Camponotus floridanus TaxID=104421 RepID=E1ZW50_CAMFO|nr:hypothetical protein EAG_11081 [Camponotus floridanus]